jgi:TonB-linked SusC/RagA family outer membrane protein
MKLRYLQIASSICITCCHLGMSHPALASQTYSKMLTKEYVVTKKNVNGTIVDKDGNPLIGVTIFEKGTDNGCITDFNGQYQLSLSNRDAVIVISYVGYKTQELKGDQLVEKIVLEEDAVALDELVVVGYAVQKKKELTGSTSSLKASDKKLSVTTSLDQMMQGNLSGVNITNASGMPGGAVRVSIRGVGSINGSNEPLFVIDGIPVSNSDNSGVNGRFGGSVQNPLSMLNPNDIESIDVLKDAAATAIYGSRATNGVVMVTTKRGKKGQRTTVNLSASYGLQSLPKEIEMADSDLYLTVRNEAVNNYNTQNNLKPGDNLYKTLEVNPRPGQPDTDWIDLITHDQAAVQNYEVSVSSGSEKTRFYSSLGYFDQEGIILTNRFRRYSLRTNVDHDISNAFQTGVSIALSKTINNRVPNDNVGNGIFTRSIEQRPFKEDGRYMIGGVDIPRHNGIQVLNEQKSKNEWYRVLANAYLTIKLLEGLEYKLSLSGDIRYSNDYLKLTKDHPYGSPKGEITDYRSMMQNYLIDNTLTYTKQIKDFNFTALGGYSMQEINTDASSIVGKDFPSSQFDYINAAGRINSASTTGGKNRLISTFFRLNMGYADRYLFTFSIRADGSSKFADGNQWGTFPSVSGAWRISNESFFPKDGIISDLKLRASWGMTGNQEGIGNYDSRSLANGGHNYNGQDGIAITTLANPDLKWEKSDQTNIGLDLSLFNDRVTVGMDYFIKNTKDLLYDRPLHTTTGFSSITQNIGSMRNTGFEFNVESHNIMNDRFSWDTQFNISTIKNKLTSLIDEKPIPVGNHVLQVGQPIGSFYMYKMDGIYQDNQEVPEKLYAKGVRAGDIKYADKDNDGDLTPADKEIVGKPLPDFFGGLTNRFRYGNFDLTIFNTFSVGNDVYATGMGGIDAVGHNNYGMRKDIAANRWTGPGTNNSIPRAMISTHNTQASTYLLHDGSYFKFKDVTLGYTLPSNLTQKLNISNMRVYLSAQNLWTISSYPGYDPEVSYSVNNSKTMGEDAMTVPQLRTFVCGFNLTF